MFVAVFPHKFETAWTGDAMPEPTAVAADIRDALAERYRTDAHFAPYMLRHTATDDWLRDGRGRPGGIRAGTEAEKHLERWGVRIAMTVLPIDVDCHDEKGAKAHVTPEWWASQLGGIQRVGARWGIPGWYQTAHGYRLVWPLPTLLDPAQFKRISAVVRDGLAAVGIVADELTAWGQLFRLPYVVRDGKPQDWPADLDGMQPLNLECAELSVALASPSNPLAGVRDVNEGTPLQIPDKIHDGHGRYRYLFKFACSLRAQGFDLASISQALRTMNEQRLVPPKGVKAVDKIARQVVDRYEPPAARLAARNTALPTTLSRPAVDGDELSDPLETPGLGRPRDRARFAAVTHEFTAWGRPNVELTRGDEVEIANVLLELMELRGPIIYDRGALHWYLPRKGIWAQLSDAYVSQWLYDLAGVPVDSGKDRDGRPKTKDLLVGNTLVKGVIKTIENMTASPGFFDGASSGVCFTNGTLFVDASGELSLRAHSPDYRMRWGFDFAWQSDADCPKFDRMLVSMFPDDPETIAMVTEFFGCCILGCIHKLQKALLLVGSGENGKSSLLDVLMACFCPTTVTAVVPQKLGAPYNLAQIARARVNLVNELPGNTKLIDSEPVKALISGETCVGRHPYGRPFEFRARCGFAFSGNKLPPVADHTRGFWRRWLIAVCKATFPEGKRVVDIAGKIVQAELRGVIARLIRAGATAYGRGHVAESRSSRVMVQRWKTDADQVQQWCDDRCDKLEAARTERKAWTLSGDLYDDYKRWATRTGHKQLAQNSFGGRLIDIGLEKRRSSAGNRWNLKLRGVSAKPYVPFGVAPVRTSGPAQ